MKLVQSRISNLILYSSTSQSNSYPVFLMKFNVEFPDIESATSWLLVRHPDISTSDAVSLHR